MLLPQNHHLQCSSIGIIKPPANSCSSASSSTVSTNISGSNCASSPSSTIATRKPRTPRKRPNQTYNEAAALLSTAYPNLFNSPKSLTSDLSYFFPDDDSLIPEKSITPTRTCVKFYSSSPAECDSRSHSQPKEFDDDEEDEFGSILDEEVDELGIDGIMGNLSVDYGSVEDGRPACFGYPIGLGLGLGFGIRALRGDFGEANWWRFPTVDMAELSTTPTVKKKTTATMKKMKKAKAVAEVAEARSPTKESEGLLLLKLNYEAVLRAWSDKGSPFSEDAPVNQNDDVAARLAQIELFPGGRGAREANVLRYKEKRRARLFSKKIRYQVRKVNADQRPRMKGRFVRRPNSKHE